jgi:hypothetical protein
MQTISAQGGAGGAGLQLWPHPSAPAAQAEQLGGLPAAGIGQGDPTGGSQRPTPATQPQQRTAGAAGPSDSRLERIAQQTSFYTPGADVRQKCS